MPRSRLLLLAAVGVMALAVAATLAWQSGPQVDSLASSAGPPVASSSSPSSVVVAVSGRVKRPGLVRLPAGARVADALEGAGGVVPGTELGALNLARKVRDGELIAVGTPVTSAAPIGSEPGSGALLDLNAATAEQLQTLPGIGATLAGRIISYREANGGFGSVEELRQVDGIGDSRYQQLKDLVTV